MVTPQYCNTARGIGSGGGGRRGGMPPTNNRNDNRDVSHVFHHRLCLDHTVLHDTVSHDIRLYHTIPLPSFYSVCCSSLLSYPLCNLIISPHCKSVPHSSQTERFTEPVLSATRHERTSWPSFVLFGFPKRKEAGKRRFT